jgi:hypothetical protein
MNTSIDTMELRRAEQRQQLRARYRQLVGKLGQAENLDEGEMGELQAIQSELEIHPDQTRAHAAAVADRIAIEHAFAGNGKLEARVHALKPLAKAAEVARRNAEAEEYKLWAEIENIERQIQNAYQRHEEATRPTTTRDPVLYGPQATPAEMAETNTRLSDAARHALGSDASTEMLRSWMVAARRQELLRVQDGPERFLAEKDAIQPAPAPAKPRPFEDPMSPAAQLRTMQRRAEGGRVLRVGGAIAAVMAEN